jgi:C4-dicarboxylate-specific signal transduction histidine kinase
VILLFLLISGYLRERKRRLRAEIEIQRTREQLACASNVLFPGKLAASLIHEINQPLTCIMLNAQVAGHLLATNGGKTDELRAILEDIVDDDKRASEIIVRIRELICGHSDSEKTRKASAGGSAD